MKKCFFSIFVLCTLQLFALEPKYVGLFKVTMAEKKDKIFYPELYGGKWLWTFEFKIDNTFILRMDINKNGNFDKDEIRSGNCQSYIENGKTYLKIGNLIYIIEIWWEGAFRTGKRHLKLVSQDENGNITVLNLEEYKF